MTKKNVIKAVVAVAIVAVVAVILVNAIKADDGAVHVPSDWWCEQVSDEQINCYAPVVPAPTPTPTPVVTQVGGTVYCYADGNHELYTSNGVKVFSDGVHVDTVYTYEDLVAYGWEYPDECAPQSDEDAPQSDGDATEPQPEEVSNDDNAG